MELRLDFGVYPRARDGRPPQSMQAMKRKMEFYFREEPKLDKPVLMSDCGSRKRAPLGLESVCLSLLEHSYSSSVEGGARTRVFGTVDGNGGQILQEPESMEQVQEDADEHTRSGGGAQR